MSGTNLMRATQLPVAVEIAELLIAKQDLEISLASLNVWLRRYADTCAPTIPPTENLTIAMAAFRDGIIQFVGCFDGDTNSRPLVVETVYPDVDGIGPFFKYLRRIRNYYAAHRHGATRQCAVGIFVDPNTGEYIRKAYLEGTFAGINEVAHDQLFSTVRGAIEYVDARLKTLWDQFEVEAKAMTSEDRLKLPLAEVTPFGTEDMALSRGDLRKGTSPKEHTIAHFGIDGRVHYATSDQPVKRPDDPVG